MTDMLRPRVAARRFGVSRDTLRRWADDGLIGRSRIGRVVFVRASDIEALIASAPVASRPTRVTRPTLVPASEDWRDSELWRGVVIR